MTTPSPVQDAPVLSIGAVLGDSDAANMAWRREISALGREVIALRAGMESPLKLNVVFHVSGRLAPNEFEGVRVGRFSRKEAKLLVQAAVPDREVGNRRSVLIALIYKALAEAEDVARAEGIAGELSHVRELLGRLTEG